MSILNDKSIREMIQKGKLVVDGDLKRVAQSAYQFVAGRIFPAGETSTPLNWVGDKSEGQEFLVPPGGLVWIRTRESVRMPPNLCGLWFQTNTLAREGLMLVNLSIVDPGYEGPLACNFVNFGKHPILITPTTPLAKMIFVHVESAVEHPFRAVSDRYDDSLRKHALQAPESFLQVTEIAGRLLKEREEALDAIRTARDELTRNLKMDLDNHVTDLKVQLEKKREGEWAALNADLNKFVGKSLGWTAGVVVLCALLWSFVPKFQDFLVGDTINSKISSAVEKEVARRTVILLEQGGQSKTVPTPSGSVMPSPSFAVPTGAASAPDAGAPDAATP